MFTRLTFLPAAFCGVVQLQQGLLVWCGMIFSACSLLSTPLCCTKHTLSVPAMVLVPQDEGPTYCSMSGCHCTRSAWPLLETIQDSVGGYIHVYPMGHDVNRRTLSWLLCQGLDILKGCPSAAVHVLCGWYCD